MTKLSINTENVILKKIQNKQKRTSSYDQNKHFKTQVFKQPNQNKFFNKRGSLAEKSELEHTCPACGFKVIIKPKKDLSKVKTDPAMKEFIKSQDQFIIPTKSPYEAYRNYKILRDFFNIEVIESHMNRKNSQFEVKCVPLKTSSQPLQMRTYNRFDESNVFNSHPYHMINFSKSKDDLNSDLPIKIYDPEQRLKTSQTNHRSNSPTLSKQNIHLKRVSTSPKAFRNKNKYYTLIEEAMRMSSKLLTNPSRSK